MALEIRETLKRILHDTFGIDGGESPAKTLDELGLDSLSLVEFALEVRRETGAQIGALDVRSDLTIDALAEIVISAGAA